MAKVAKRGRKAPPRTRRKPRVVRGSGAVFLKQQLAEARAQQEATAEVLASMSGSMTDAQPVFDAIARNVARLLRTRFSAIQLVRDGHLHLVGFSGPGFERLKDYFPQPADGETAGAKALKARRVLQFAPIVGNPKASKRSQALAKEFDYNANIAVPLVREGKAIGAIVTARHEGKAFDARQVALLKTFADQAVIAIENVRLFNETREALERQTATAEILKVIASSPSDVQPVFDAIAASALRLIGGRTANVTRLVGNELHLVAFTAVSDSLDEAFKKMFPSPLTGQGASGRAILSGRPAAVSDFDTDAAFSPAFREVVRARGMRSVVAVPMIREGEAIGTISVARSEAGNFTDHQINLLKTFADQAVIAIENVRLFNETKEALEQQTATAEILKAISDSPTDVQPVFEAIVRSGIRLFKDAAVAVTRPDGDMFKLMAIAEHDPELAARWAAAYPTPVDRTYMHGAAILDCRMVEVSDALDEGEPFPEGRRKFSKTGYRAITVMPMLRDGACIGTISVVRAAPGPLSEKQKAVLHTFADQAVIAIENVRLFNETREALERQTATAEILRVIGSSMTDAQPVFDAIVKNCGSLFKDSRVTLWLIDENQLHPRASNGDFVGDPMPIDREAAIGVCVLDGIMLHLPDLEKAVAKYPRIRQLGLKFGYRSGIYTPLMREGKAIGGISVLRRESGAFEDSTLVLLSTFADQAVIAIQNVRHFHEIQEKSRLLEEASKHKSNFLASMSHELRTPLNAILGFNEMLLGQVYGEVPADMKEPLEDIQKSGKHLLRLINNVLDLAKIEAGRMELSLSDYSVQDTVESVRSTLRPLAAEKGLEFLASVPNDVPLAYGDGGRIAQCLMNLAGNSLKFTKAGKVEISVELRGDQLVYRVADTGIGIPPDKIGGLFTEFKQTDATIASEYGGTGLGLSISRQFIEMHGGRIWVESEVGKGSTFIFELPLRMTA